jgi:hypothetical protein
MDETYEAAMIYCLLPGPINFRFNLKLPVKIFDQSSSDQRFIVEITIFQRFFV